MRKDAAARRESLIEVAAQTFERDGYDVPLDAIVIAAGLGRGTLYRNFPDRGSLMAEVLTHKLGEMERFVDAHEEDETLLDVFIRRHGLLGSLHAPAVARLQADRSLRDTLNTLIERVSVLLEQVVARSQAAGTLRRDATSEDLRLVIRMLMTMAHEPSEPHEAIDNAARLVTEGLSPR